MPECWELAVCSGLFLSVDLHRSISRFPSRMLRLHFCCGGVGYRPLCCCCCCCCLLSFGGRGSGGDAGRSAVSVSRSSAASERSAPLSLPPLSVCLCLLPSSSLESSSLAAWLSLGTSSRRQYSPGSFLHTPRLLFRRFGFLFSSALKFRVSGPGSVHRWVSLGRPSVCMGLACLFVCWLVCEKKRFPVLSRRLVVDLLISEFC